MSNGKKKNSGSPSVKRHNAIIILRDIPRVQNFERSYVKYALSKQRRTKLFCVVAIISLVIGVSRSLSLEQDNWQHSQHYLSLMGTGKLLGTGGSHFAPIQRLGLALTLLFLWSHSYSISCDHRNSWMIYQKYTYHPGFSHALKRPRGSKSTNQLARR